MTLHGLGTRFELNGSKGVIGGVPDGDGADMRYNVRLDGKDELIRVKPGNLKLLVGAPNMFS